MKNKPKVKAKSNVGNTLPNVFYVLLPIVVTAVFFAPVLGFDILNWDDKGYILENPLVNDFSFVKFFSQYWMGNYHPFTMLIFTIGYKLFGLSGLFFHSINLIFHLFNVFLVYRLVEKLVPNNFFVASLTALLFGIHPMHIESVAWVSELKDVLYATFFLLSLTTYINYLTSGGKIRYILSLVFFLFSLFSKGQAVVLTPVIILIDILWKRKYNLAVIVEKIPFIVMSIVFGIIAIKAQQSVSALSYGMVDAKLNYLYGFYNYVSYIQKFFLPGLLSGIHPYVSTPPSLLYVYAFLFFLIVAAGFVLAWKTGPLTFFGLSFFLVTISIVVKFVPVGEALIAERYTYIPYFGLFLLLSMCFSWLLKKPKYKKATLFLLFVFLGSLILPGFNYLKTYKNSETYWLNIIKFYPSYWRPYYTVSLHYIDNNQNVKAIEYNTKAIELVSVNDHKELANLYYNRASIFFNKTSEFSLALNDYMKVVEYDSTKKDLFSYIGFCYYKLDRIKEASGFLKRAILKDSTNAKSFYLLALSNMECEQFEDAYENLGKAISLQPDFSLAYLKRAVLCTDFLPKQELAVKDFLFLIETKYQLDEVYLNLAVCYLKLGKNNDVLISCDKAISSAGNKGKAFYIKALAYDKMNQKTAAFNCGQNAIKSGYPVDSELMRKWK